MILVSIPRFLGTRNTLRLLRMTLDNYITE